MASAKKTKSKKPEQKRPDTGPTEDKMAMGATIPQHIDDKGTKVEDEAGTGENDALGG
jgi:hypothetical protein